MKTITLLSSNHWNLKDYKQRMTTQDWKKILLDEADQIIFRGNLVQLKAKSLGCGVVEVGKVFKR